MSHSQAKHPHQHTWYRDGPRLTSNPSSNRFEPLQVDDSPETSPKNSPKPEPEPDPLSTEIFNTPFLP